ncbi:MAG: hypothetical protein ACE147_18375 [Candidatus Methylomirabilales bacterium]
MTSLVARILSRLRPARLCCPHCGAAQRVGKASIAGEFRVVCWRCKRVFSP